MSLYIDEQYLHNISHGLRNFKKKADHMYQLSCPLCGDSEKHKWKAHAYFFRGDDVLIYKCHKCAVALPFGAFLRTLDASAYKDYIREVFCENLRHAPVRTVAAKTEGSKLKAKTVIMRLDDLSRSCPSIASLPPDHQARLYIVSRQIPLQFHEELYFADRFADVASIVCPDHHSCSREGRIVIPFLNVKRQLIAIQGRALGEASIRYITVKRYEDAPRIFGMERLTFSTKRIYAVEGPFDSYFLPNCVAFAGSDIPQGFPRQNTVIVYDNEPRSIETCRKISKAIDRKYQVCIWPHTIKEKDLNAMILAGYKAETLQNIVDTHSYSGLLATEILRQWKKC